MSEKPKQEKQPESTEQAPKEEKPKQEKQPESTIPGKKKKISKMTLPEIEEALKKAVQDQYFRPWQPPFPSPGNVFHCERGAGACARYGM